MAAAYKSCPEKRTNWQMHTGIAYGDNTTSLSLKYSLRDFNPIAKQKTH